MRKSGHQTTIFLGLVCGCLQLAQADGVQVMRDLVYAERASGPLAADLYLPAGDGPFPGILMVHGGAWMAGHKTHSAWHARRLARAGFAAIAIDYRLAPVHKFPAQLDDCHQAFQWIVARAAGYRIDARRLGAFGYSAGGHLVCLLGSKLAQDLAPARTGDGRLRAIVAGGAPCDFRGEPLVSSKLVYWLGGTRSDLPEVYRLASPAEFAAPHVPPIFFFHGERDRIVPKQNPLLLNQQLQRLGVASEVYVVPQAGHVKAFLDAQAFDRSVQFLSHHLSHADRE